MVTLGLAVILAGTAAPTGVMPAIASMKKIGKAYKDSAKFGQEPSEVTEHFEEGNVIPVVRKVAKKVPKFTFSIMDADIDTLVRYVGGTKVAKSGSEKTKWAFDGTEVVENCSILIQTEQGLHFEVPNAAVEATINSDMSAKGIFLVDFVITPMAVDSGKGLRAYDPKEA